MTAKKPITINQTTGRREQTQLTSSDLSDGPFGVAVTYRKLQANLTINDGVSYVVGRPLDMNGHVLTIASGGIVVVV